MPPREWRAPSNETTDRRVSPAGFLLPERRRLKWESRSTRLCRSKDKGHSRRRSRGPSTSTRSGRNLDSDRRVKLPGNVYVGIRTNSGELPTLDINSPETGRRKYLYK